VKSSKQRVKTSQFLALSSVPTIAYVPPQLSLINDTDFSPQELRVYRTEYNLYMTHYTRQGCIPVVMRYLWNHHGLTFSNEALRSAALAGLFWHTECSYVCQSRISRFNRAMMKSLQSGKIEKEHVFAIFFVIVYGVCVYFDDAWIHILGFEAVLRHLIQQTSDIHNFSNDISLTDILVYMTWVVQLQAMGLAGPIPKDRIHKLISDLQSLSLKLQHPSRRLALLFDSTTQSGLVSNVPTPGFLTRCHDVVSDISIHLFQFVHETVTAQPNAVDQLHLAEEKLKMLENSPAIQQAFKKVHSWPSDVLIIREKVEMFI
jgi:hypothetical protein